MSDLQIIAFALCCYFAGVASGIAITFILERGAR